jgi:hypothetical protein
VLDFGRPPQPSGGRSRFRAAKRGGAEEIMSATLVRSELRRKWWPVSGSSAPWLSALLFLLAIPLLLGVGSAPASAAACTADYQCRQGVAVGRNSFCLGNTQVTKSFQCVSGQCRAIDMGRVTCPGRCDASTGSCVAAGPVPSLHREIGGRCICKDKTLIVTGANARIRHCRHACSCDPTPHCRGR